MDTESIIKGIVTEYIKPMFPIYRVWYIHHYIINDGTTLLSDQICTLFEIIPIDDGDELMEVMINHPKTMSDLLRRNFESFGVTVHKYSTEHFTIYKMERVA